MSWVILTFVVLGVVVLAVMLGVRGRTGEPPSDAQPEVETGPAPPVQPGRPVPGSRPHREEHGSP